MSIPHDEHLIIGNPLIRLILVRLVGLQGQYNGQYVVL